MKFSDDTMMVLKNFSEINPNIMFKEGTTLTTLAPTKQVMAKAVLKDTFPTKACVYDLSRFLATVSLIDNPDIDFEDDRFEIKNNRTHISYTYAAESMIITSPKDELDMPETFGTWKVSGDVLRNLTRAAGVLGLPEIEFKSDGQRFTVSTVDSKNPNSDTYQEELDFFDSLPEFRITVNVENLRLLPGDYDVSISENIVHFQGEDVEYWIAANSNGGK